MQENHQHHLKHIESKNIFGKYIIDPKVIFTQWRQILFNFSSNSFQFYLIIAIIRPRQKTKFKRIQNGNRKEFIVIGRKLHILYLLKWGRALACFSRQNVVTEIYSDNLDLVCDNRNLLCDNKNLLCDNTNLLCDNKNLLCDNKNLLCDNTNLLFDDTHLFSDNTNLHWWHKFALW